LNTFKDSVFFVSDDNDTYIPATGENLGDLTNEIDSKKGNFIQTFVSAGPKNYAYKTDTGYTHCCVKGFTLNFIASLVVNFDSIKHIVCNDNKKTLKAKQLKFNRNTKHWTVDTSIVEKTYNFVYDKRILYEDLSTRPFGFHITSN